MRLRNLSPLILLLVIALSVSPVLAQIASEWTISDDFTIGGASTYTVTYTLGVGGSITPSYPGGVATVASGSNLTFTITPALHYRISSVVVDGNNTGTPSTLNFLQIYTNHVFQVYFALDLYYITASADANIDLSPSGLVAVNSGDDQTFTYSAHTGYVIDSILVNGTGVAITSPSGTYTFSNVNGNSTFAIYSAPAPSTIPTITPTPVPSPNPYNHPIETLNLYMRSDTYNFTDVSAYGLDTDYTNTHISVPISNDSVSTITYGFRIYLASSSTSYQELTNGVPAATIALSSNYTGQISSSWSCPDTQVILGTQVLQVVVYAKIDNGSWTAQATFISNPLMTHELMPTVWAFTLNLNMTQTTGSTSCLFSFGDTDYRSTVTNIEIVTPNYTDIQGWQWMHGDIIGLILGSYLHVLGAFFWVLIYVAIFGSLWFRHKSTNPVVFIAILMGGGFGLGVWALLPTWIAAILSVFIILALMTLVFKVIR